MDDLTADIKRVLEEADPTITVVDFVSTSDESSGELEAPPRASLN
jgi:hypothetical protein